MLLIIELIIIFIFIINVIHTDLNRAPVSGDQYWESTTESINYRYKPVWTQTRLSTESQCWQADEYCRSILSRS